MISGVWPTLQQNGPLNSLNNFMYKLFMVMCVLVNGEIQCTDYDDSEANIYKNLNDCEQDAHYRFYGLTDIFENYGQPYESIVMGCKDAED